MSRNRSLIGLILVGIVVVAGYLWTTRSATRVDVTPVAVSEQQGGEAVAERSIMRIEVAGEANGVIELELFDDVAPAHVERMTRLADAGSYDGVVFHRVIDGFMAQSGDVEFGRSDGDTSRAGMGGSDMPDLPAEFSDQPFDRGVLGMARAANPNSANSQFFIMFAPAPHLNGQYTVVGRVTSGLEVLDAIKRGRGPNGAVLGEPDRMVKVTVTP